MELIIGGKCQGKLNYVLEQYGLKNEDVFFAEGSDSFETSDKKILYGFHALVKKWLSSGLDVSVEIAKLRFDIIITDEIGNGIVPIDSFERMWREETGRACCIIAKKSEKVTRVFCGIPTVIK